MSFKQDYITGLYYRYMGDRRIALARLELLYESSCESDSAIIDLLKELGDIDSILTTLQREYPNIIKISQAPTPASS